MPTSVTRTNTFLNVAYGTANAYTQLSALQPGTLYFTTDDKYLHVKAPGSASDYILETPMAKQVSQALTLKPVHGDNIEYDGSTASTISNNMFLDAHSHIPLEYIPRAAVERIIIGTSSASSYLNGLVGDDSDSKAQVGDLIKINNAQDPNNGKVYYVGGSIESPTFTEFSVGTAAVADSLSNSLILNVNGTENDFHGQDTTVYIKNGLVATNNATNTSHSAVTAASGSIVYLNLLGTTGSSAATVIQGISLKGTEPLRISSNASGQITIGVQQMVGTNGITDGKSGLVPAPTSTNASGFLKADGTWTVPNDTHYDAYLYVTNSATSTIPYANGSLINGNVYLNVVEHSIVRSSYKLRGLADIGVVYSDATLTIGHTNSTITANTVGPVTGATINAGSEFSVPYVAFDQYGHISAADTTTIKMGTITQPSYYSPDNGASELATIFGHTIYGGVTWGSF